MQLRKFDLDAFHREYNVSCRDMYPWPEVEKTPFGATWVVVDPGGHTEPHSHELPETFFITEGSGTMKVDGATQKVGEGDVVFLPATSEHTIENLSSEERLVFLSVYWDDDLGKVAEMMEAGALRPVPQAPPLSAARRLVISAPPTPNGLLHLGHISGPYLGADVYRRYSQMRGAQSFHLTGSDDYQSFLAEKARELGKEREACADFFTEGIRSTFSKLGIDTHFYTLPRSIPRYNDFVQQVFGKLLKDGKVEIHEADIPYCEDCERYLYGAYIVGNCPHCGTRCMGNGCEECGLPNDCGDMTNTECAVCEATPVIKKLEKAYFPLEKQREFLTNYYAGLSLPPRLRAVTNQLLAKPLPLVPVTHPSDWGIAVNDERLPGQIVSVWTEMAIIYLYTSDLLRKQESLEKNFWDDEQAEVVQFFGCDNAFYYATMFPALMAAVHPRVRQPHAFVTNEHYQFVDSKFSTSRGHAIWADEMLDRAPPDVIRFHLCRTRPEQRKTVFTEADFEFSWQGLLVGQVQEWLLDLGRRTYRDFSGQVPSISESPAPAAQQFINRLSEFWSRAATAYESETFSPAEVVRTLLDLVACAHEYGAGYELLREVGEVDAERTEALALELMAARDLAVMSAPIMPGFSRRLWRDLGCRGRVKGWLLGREVLPPGQKLRGLKNPFFEPLSQDLEE